LSQANEAQEGSESWRGVEMRRQEQGLRNKVKGEEELRREGGSGGWVETLETRATMRSK
jgi:hypothetical protein